MSDLIKPQSVQVKDVDGNEKEFIISRLPATVGREIIARYPLANAPKIGDYGVSTEAMYLMMQYVGVPINNGNDGESILRLKTKALVDNHITDGEQLIRLEFEMLKYNTSFFGIARKFGSLQEVLNFLAPLITQTLTHLSQQSSPANTPHTESYKPS
jgi:hypothetical protein